ncbi:aromatic-ring hydroxylase C-terminal domain-containing protein, partial [Streptomyces zaehneri]|uniref:aromatic-ring hydroxylase C-terminal domain-containing protein n=1 Tax=Streptomyces zaehneri TaxID=3051180 RepID=UPI0028D1E53F
ASSAYGMRVRGGSRRPRRVCATRLWAPPGRNLGHSFSSHRASGRRTALLVRPDGQAAWAFDTAEPDAVAAALATHVG